MKMFHTKSYLSIGAAVALWWFDFPSLHVEVSLSKILNPKLLLMCWLAPCMAATDISVFMN